MLVFGIEYPQMNPEVFLFPAIWRSFNPKEVTLEINLYRVSAYIFKSEHNVVGSNDESLSGKTGLC